MQTAKLATNEDMARVRWGRGHQILVVAILLVPMALGFLVSSFYQSRARKNDTLTVLTAEAAKKSSELHKVTWGMPRFVSFVVVEGIGEERTETYWSAFGTWTTIGFSGQEWRPVDDGNVPQYTAASFMVLGILACWIYKLTDIVWLVGHGVVAFVTGGVSVLIGTLLGL